MWEQMQDVLSLPETAEIEELESLTKDQMVAKIVAWSAPTCPERRRDRGETIALQQCV